MLTRRGEAEAPTGRLADVTIHFDWNNVDGF
jgi:hypothetical protein